MGGAVIEIIGLIIIAIGVIAIYDARNLSKKYFSTSDKNGSAKLLRIAGFILEILGIVIIYII